MTQFQLDTIALGIACVTLGSLVVLATRTVLGQMTLEIQRSMQLEEFGKVKTYKKTATVKAVQIGEFFAVATLEGFMHGDAGDYLCEGIEGEKWPVKKEIFEKTYEVVEN